MSTTTENTKEVDQIVHEVVELGASWARYGLTVGRSELETSAKTLSTTASLLGDLAKRFETEAGQTHKLP